MKEMNPEMVDIEPNAPSSERGITLKTCWQPKRWSLQVPVKEMNPEMVDMKTLVAGSVT
jgi:hypothetical protein